jgi:membrane associated rhomboid family serine protease
MDVVTMRIPARSRRQALDWSLVLASQAIECTVAAPEPPEGWGLVVSSLDYAKASEALQLYHAENRHWQWRRQLFKPGLLFDWTSLAWAALVIFFFLLSESRPGLTTAGRVDAFSVWRGQWWRLFTAVWLHGDLGHLAANVSLGFPLLGLTMGRYGTGAGLLAAYLTGAGGNLFDICFSPRTLLSLGASGILMGTLGLLAVQSVPLWRRNPHARAYIITAVVAGMMLFAFLGLSPGTDFMAHAGGFLMGLVLGALLAPIPRLAQNFRLNFLSGLLFLALTLWPWWNAFQHRS